MERKGSFLDRLIMGGKLFKDRTLDGRERWGYEYFKEYLLSLTRGKEFLLHCEQDYPKRVELSRGWHQTLNLMREETKDGKERYAIVGFKDDRRAIYLPTAPAIGLDACVPSEVIAEARRKASVEYKIPYLLGDLHSHPPDFALRYGGKTHFSLDLGFGFSVGDFYCLVASPFFFPFMGVVDGETNLFMFLTRASEQGQYAAKFFDQESFTKFWYERNGFKYLGHSEKYGEMAIPAKLGASLKDVNQSVAKAHGLVLYGGGVNKDLVRVFP